MAKCFNCGKNFDYEKYYGICPKCGSYNREETPEEEHQKLHEQYDTAQVKHAHYETEGQGTVSGGGTAQYRYSGAKQQYYSSAPQAFQGGQSAAGRAKATPAAIVVFILLILGIIGTILFPVFYTVGKSMQLGFSVVRDISYGNFSDVPDTWDSYEDFSGGSEDYVWKEQSAPVVAVKSGDICYLGSAGELQVTVGEARVRVPAGYVDDFPEGERLVAISVAHADNSDSYGDYRALDMLYVGYGENTYRECLTSYDMEEYLNVLGSIRIVDRYNISYGEDEGEILVFVPEEVTSLELYLESRNEDTYELQKIYRISLEIKPGEEI